MCVHTKKTEKVVRAEGDGGVRGGQPTEMSPTCGTGGGFSLTVLAEIQSGNQRGQSVIHSI